MSFKRYIAVGLGVLALGASRAGATVGETLPVLERKAGEIDRRRRRLGRAWQRRRRRGLLGHGSACAGEQDNDPVNPTDCATASEAGTELRAAELQVFSANVG